MRVSRSIRFGDLYDKIAEEAEADDRKFSDEVRHLCRLGLREAKKAREEKEAKA